MVRWIFYGAVLLAAGAFGAWALHRWEPNDHVRPLAWLVVVLPFAAGGFYTFLAPLVSGYLLWYLWKRSREARTAGRRGKKESGLRIYVNLSLVAILLLTVMSLCSILWAADHGMAVWGFVRYIPLVLYVLALMQLEPSETGEVCRYVPLCGGIMTLVSFVASLIPALADSVLVSERLAGSFQYPNTFAAFLLVGLVITGMAKERHRGTVVLDLILIFGVFESGSRTAFVILIVILIAMCILRRERIYALSMLCVLVIGILLSLVVSRLGISPEAGRYLTSTTQSSTLLGRFLYFKDALGQILRHPFGLGYLGYYYTQGSFQTGVYSVMFVHNELLQLLLDVGWIPTVVFCVALGKAFFAKGTAWKTRLIMVVILGHSMLDFDLQFLAMWLILLPLLQIHAGKEHRLHMGGPAAAIAGVLLAVSLWLGLGDLFYTAGAVDACLAVTPFHTAARTERLKTISDTDDLSAEADKILKLDDECSLAYSAKANAFYSAGDVVSMIEAKEQAIACARYTLEEYCDYFDKLYVVMQLYQEMGDTYSAEYCREKILSIPDMLAEVEASTSALAWRIVDLPDLTLPDAYIEILDGLSG